MNIFIKLIMTLIALAFLNYLNRTDLEEKKVNLKADRRIKIAA